MKLIDITVLAKINSRGIARDDCLYNELVQRGIEIAIRREADHHAGRLVRRREQ